MISPLSSTGYSNAVYSSQSFSSPEATSQSNDKAMNDTVTISNEGKSASLFGRLDSLSTFPSTIFEFEQCLKDDTAEVEKMLRSIYRKLGVSSDTEMKISIGSDGKIIVRGDNQKAEEVAEAINNDPELKNTIKRMSANTSLLEAIKKHLEFAKAYEADPEAAIKEFAYLFENDRKSHVSFTMSNGSINSQINHV